MSVRRIPAGKKSDYAAKAGELREELENYLGIGDLKNIRVLIRYDIEDLPEGIYERALIAIFSEPPVDEIYEETFPKDPGDPIFPVEYLPGQFGRRTDSAKQCVRLLKEDEGLVIRPAVTYVITTPLTNDQEAVIRSFCISLVDSHETREGKSTTPVTEFEAPEDIKHFDGLADFKEGGLKALYDMLNLAMALEDLLHMQSYYKNEERRGPSVTEIRVLDIYQSDHYRHTTFSTELKNVSLTDGDCREPIENTYRQHLIDREAAYKGRDDRYVCFMDLALMAMKKLCSEGKLEDIGIFGEINACSIVVPVEVDGVTEEWLVNFKNGTRNHPTEIEPFGGAVACLGGAIRNPLSGRTYVHQAMRVTGAVDPIRPLCETLEGKLPQRKIVNNATQGYPSYGNQIGLATGYVKKVYHPGYVAKGMEIGVVMGAASRKDVIRESSDPGDIIILLGDRMGRNDIGGTTDSSKVHTAASIEVYGAEVQKGNAPAEQEVQKIFHRPQVSSIIEKCSSFGAGGMSVAVGELATGLKIDLDRVSKKYADLDGMEIAIFGPQERMIVVVDLADVKQFLEYAAKENLEAVTVAVVTGEPRLIMSWRGKTTVDISHGFLGTNDAHQKADVTLEVPSRKGNPSERRETGDVKAKWLEVLSGLNVCS